jgi:hypothetical protein
VASNRDAANADCYSKAVNKQDHGDNRICLVDHLPDGVKHRPQIARDGFPTPAVPFMTQRGGDAR